MTKRALAGIDGCRAGWIAAIELPGEPPRLEVFPAFKGILDSLPEDAILAVDMPIGLPCRIGENGRGPESAVRPLLGKLKSSVFPVPSRKAVYAETGPFDSWADMLAARKRADEVARETSNPPKGLPIQSFCLFPKIREIDTALRAAPDLAARVVETHPEVAFWRLNGEQALKHAKKKKSGIEERRSVLVQYRLGLGRLDKPVPHGAKEDDRLDAIACLMIAGRHTSGLTRPFPDPPLRDRFGIPMAIWV